MAQRTRRYLIRRVIVVLLTLFVVTLLSFLLMRLSPIDPATAYVKRNSAVVTQEQIDEARVMLGLDKPLPVQYFDWWWTRSTWTSEFLWNRKSGDGGIGQKRCPLP